MRKLLLVLLGLTVLAGVAGAIYWQRAGTLMRVPGPHAQSVALIGGSPRTRSVGRGRPCARC